jgi:hypothetical protein
VRTLSIINSNDMHLDVPRPYGHWQFQTPQQST